MGTIANVGTIEGIAQVGTISAYLSLSEGGFGPKLGTVDTMQGWIWSKIRQSLHYPRVELAIFLAKWTLSGWMLAKIEQN